MLSSVAEHVRLDPVSLRGLAHPLRVRILNLLREHGPANATTLSARLEQSTGSTSYHLRQLAAYGFIVEDPDLARGGRERWWKAAHQGTSLDEEVVAQAPEDAQAYLRAVAAADFDRINRWFNETVPPQWSPAATLSTWRLRMTAQEAKQLHDAIFELAARYRSDEPGAEGELVVFQAQILPFASRS